MWAGELFRIFSTVLIEKRSDDGREVTTKVTIVGESPKLTMSVKSASEASSGYLATLGSGGRTSGETAQGFTGKSLPWGDKPNQKKS